MKSILLNGKTRETDAGTVSELVKELDLDPDRIALERNGDIVRKPLYGETPVNEGDKIEIVHFVGGG
jgi:thiazole synthase